MSLKDNNGNWIDNEIDLRTLINNHFMALFCVSDNNTSMHWSIWPHNVVSPEDNSNLAMIPTREEISKAVRNIGAYKAPGPDGYQAIFYHKYWDTIGNSFCNLIQDCFTNKMIPRDMNCTNIVLIPKVTNPESITHFRPIGLSNVSYKVVSKIIVNRIRPLLDNIISPFQSSFIPGRLTTDNVIICQEIIHSLKNNKARKGGMIWKIDFDKAYDRISWDFLLESLRYFQFNEELIALIMSCVTNIEASIMWNGEPLSPFKPERGLRQGDPLSPYLFVICMERLSAFINQKVHSNLWEGIKVSTDGPCLSHLFFADDIMLFGTTTVEQCNVMKDTLDMFCTQSGQLVSGHKSKLFVSPNISLRNAKQLSNLCGFNLTKDLGMYLGVPLLHSKVSKQKYQYVIERLNMKLAGWKSDSLNLMGRATLVQSVTSTIPYYTMQTSILPASITSQVDKINSFLWGDKTDKKRIHLVNWNSVCRPKRLGGLGIRQARISNLALISKLGWRISTEKKPLWIQVLRNKYLRNHKFKDWPTNKKASHTWRSIIKVRDFVIKNIKWIVGNGRDISFWHDWWCGNSVLEARDHDTLNVNAKVADFINNEKDWDTNLLNQTLGMIDTARVTNILIPKYAVTVDTPYWTLGHNGNFSVKSSYDHLAESCVTDINWNWIWKLRVPAKLKGFLWICMHGKLLTNQQRMIRGLSTEDTCPRCNATCEDIFHLFFNCASSVNLWSRIAIVQIPSTGDIAEWRTWLQTNIRQATADKGSYSKSVLILVTLWNIWIARNKKVFDNANFDPACIHRQCMVFSSEIVNSFCDQLPTKIRQVKLIAWKFPGTGKLKLNTDGSSKGNPGPAGFGGVFREERGHWVIGFYGRLEDCSSLEAELWGLFKGLEMVKSQNMEALEIESDSATAINLIKGESPFQSPHKTLIQECQALLAATGCSLSHVYREGNQVADKLANVGVEQEEKWVSHITPPVDIIPLLEADMRGVAFERM